MKAAIVFSEALTQYDFGPGHPFRGDRFINFMTLLRAKLSPGDRYDILEPSPANDEDLLLVHNPEYINFVKEERPDPLAGSSWAFLDLDTQLTAGMNSAARALVGSALMAADLVAEGRYKIAVSVGGGMHHARPSRGAGFCVFNDVAVCVRHLQRRHGLKRILVLDTDGHAGDGTMEIFDSDPSVLVISIHQDPRTLYPGTGFPSQVGFGAGKGFTVNIPLLPRAGILSFMYALHHVFNPLAREFQPDIIIRNGGSDPHFHDQLVTLGITVPGLYMIGHYVREIAAAVCDGRVIDMVGSGYDPVVLPHAWLALVSGIAGWELALEEPVPVPPWVKEDYGLAEVTAAVATTRRHLASYWQCFAGPDQGSVPSPA